MYHPIFLLLLFFFFNDTATTEIYTLSLHDALPIYGVVCGWEAQRHTISTPHHTIDRKSTRLNSSHLGISYAVFCLKKKKKQKYMDEYYKKKNNKKQKEVRNHIS